jgi:hypothetical protein
LPDSRFDHASPTAASRPARSGRRLVFLLSDHVIDFDSYLPVALALKRERPDLDIRFVTMSRDNYEFIHANPALAAGLAAAGTLHLFDRRSGGATRRLRAALAFARVAALLVARPGTVLFHGRQFSEFPYDLLYLLNRALRGRGYLMLRVRQPDDGIKVNLLRRFAVPPGRASRVERLFGRDHDGMIVYHDQQERYVHTLNQFGRIGTVPRLALGLPNLWPEWRALIAGEVARERARLAEEGLDTSEVYTLLAPKSSSSAHLRSADSGERAFRRALAALRRHRPQATLLVRPHPRAYREPWLAKAFAELGGPRVRLTLAHPDALIALSRRIIAPNTSTIMLVADCGRFIDCTDYGEEHFRSLGRVSQCHGFDTVWVDPNSETFETELVRYLDDAAWPAGPEMTARRRSLTGANRRGLGDLLAWIEAGPPAPAERHEQAARASVP